jgi:hypothetical protein
VGTLILAILGVVLSVASLAWQLAAYFLSGPRIEAELWLGFADEDGKIRGRSPSHQIKNRGVNAWEADMTEVAVIIARNRGRAPATVVSAGLAAGKPGKGMTSRGALTADDAKSGPVRLEPADVMVYQIPLWPAIDGLRNSLESMAPNQALFEKRDLPVYAELQHADGSHHYWPKKPWLVPPEMKTIKLAT